MKNPYEIGDKIYLRSPTLEDAEGDWFQWFSDPEITMYLSDRNQPNTKEAQVAFYKSLENQKDRIVLSICRKENDKHIGVCGFSQINWFNRYADIAYIIGNKEKDSGLIIVEVMKLLLSIAFDRLGLDNLRSTHTASNQKTPVISKMFGFKEVGSMKNLVFFKGKKEDLIISQLTKQDWSARNNDSS
jgi:[ribosomal protein S5]-alanine N-acetyltransferase